ncbi:MAG TPA: trypsin-like serine protease [Thermoanaerobaculia bacterium]|nr:trypsin-like serine protease [Thermoanaerobaculia bacterium]
MEHGESRDCSRPTLAAFGLALALIGGPQPAAGAAAPPNRTDGKVINGELSWAMPAVGFFVSPRAEGVTSCSGTLIGCRTFVTATHCLCTLVDEGRALTGAECRKRADLLDPTGKRVFFQHAGFVDVTEVVVHPQLQVGSRSDLAILRLAEPVTGVRTARINQQARVPHGTPGMIVGFGRASVEENDRGLKRTGGLTFAPCLRAPASTNLCYDYGLTSSAPGVGSGASGGDSGGPQFADLGAGPRLVSVTSGASVRTEVCPTCPRRFNAFSSDVFVERGWIEEVAGADLHTSGCGGLPPAGEAGGSILFGGGALSEAEPEARFSLEVPPGTVLLRVTLNGESPFTNELTLYLRAGAPPSPAAFDCAGEGPGGLQACEVPAPEPGTWHVLARRLAGDAALQLTATLFPQPGDGGAPEPPEGPWLSSPGLPGFEAQVRFGGTTPGAREPGCIAETLCTSGALAGRPELFLKVIGPRPNGYLWAQISRFTPSQVEVWLRQLANGQVNYYELVAVGPGSDDVSGLQDREAFSPGIEPDGVRLSPEREPRNPSRERE